MIAKSIFAARVPGLSWLEATINMAKAFARGAIIIKPYRVPENQQCAEGAANIEKWKRIAHTLVLPSMEEALTDLETPEAPADALLFELLANIVYFQVGLKLVEGKMVRVYAGRAKQDLYRGSQHDAAQVKWSIADLDLAPFHYHSQGMGDCDVVLEVSTVTPPRELGRRARKPHSVRHHPRDSQLSTRTRIRSSLPRLSRPSSGRLASPPRDTTR